MSKLLLLKSASSLSDVATLLGFSPSGLSFVLYKQDAASKYKKFQIPKKAGGSREICAPLGATKAVQRELATLLNICRAEILASSPRRPISHGFRESLSIITNAHNHTARRYVFNIDLADFFPTLNFGRVRGFFLKDRDFALHDKVATVLAQIACFENALPQGSPCSPVIADMIAHVLDVRLVGLAKKYRVTYSRYADDLTFSTNQKNFPPDLGEPDPSAPGAWIAAKRLIKAVEGAGFKVNPSKTRMQFRGSRQVVTGLTVNAKVNISQKYWRSIRSMCHALYTEGEYHHPTPKGRSPLMIKSLAPLAGMLSHALNVKRESKRLPYENTKDIVFGQLDHMRFWFYKYFAAPTRPVIVCEGKTDNVYLRNAIRRLTAFHPRLGKVTPDGFRYAISLFSYTNLVHKILRITGGIGPVLSFIYSYNEQLKHYKNRPLEHPVIVLVDNDTALNAKNCNALKKRFGVAVAHSATDPFFFLTDNLYLVKTPLVGSLTMSCIEDLFDATTKAMPLGGKVFHVEEGFDPTKHIGKAPFATKVVSPNADKISWADFSLLLDRIVAVLDDYAARIAAEAKTGFPARPPSAP